ncbi:uncharacterized protein Hap1MRO34_002448 isoform 1-T3 [Clarias gariepinus]|uniref:uncharacterized protein LOC128515780 isoform X1 n=1 Tax=Clarias gariepinus TaxID=13013 RepID=UPI00234CE8CA|nr:uncharacterized protein LOC128515780 isoform X1 [Clarias gariepinus]XP_053345917.1 uncharacterized protein LOC128515780 isoform X1 [Clarias gariepinus]
MENITTVSCTNISAGGHFTYVLVPFLVTVLQGDKDCEQAWYNEAKEFLSDGQVRNRTGLVVDVTSENITLSKCIKLYSLVTCHGSGHKFQHIYQVINDFSSQGDVERQKNTTSITRVSGVKIEVVIVVLIVVPILVLIAICYFLNQRRIGGVCQRLMQGNRTDKSYSEDLDDVKANGYVNGGGVNEALLLQASVGTVDDA